jgi:hypothetical protein
VCTAVEILNGCALGEQEFGAALAERWENRSQDVGRNPREW